VPVRGASGPRVDHGWWWCYNISALINKCRGKVTHDTPAERALKLLAERGVARSRDLERAGVTRTQVRRLSERGVIERVGYGLYRDPRAELSELADLAEASRRVPDGVVCLLSALRFHRLGTQNPFEVWLAIGRKAWRPRVEHPPLRLVYLSGASFEEGVEVHDVEGGPVRVYCAAKTVADCFKFRHKIGTDVAVEALRSFRESRPKELTDVWRYAQTDRVGRVIAPYLEALT
jgi:predicted transcriptional regulator of viral defense system